MVWWMWASQFAPYIPSQGSVSAADAQDARLPADTLSRHSIQAGCLWTPEDGCFQFSDNWQRVTSLDPAACFEQGLLGLASAASHKEWNEALRDLVSPDPCERVDMARVQLECAPRRGDTCWLDVTLVPVQMRGRAGLSLLVSNITEQKQMEQAVERALRESQMAQHGRSSFLSNMSHELRTPLNAILGFAQLMEYMQDASPEQARDYLKHIRESGEDLLFKINDLLEVANVDSQACRMQESAQNISDLIDAAIEMHSHTAYAREVRVCQPVKPRPAIVVQVDRAQMIHVFSNLLSDAIRRCDKGGIVQFDWRTDDKGDLSISISDDGSGFSHKQLGNIKTALRSKRSYFLTDIDHIGVGMSVAKELVSLHGGELLAEHCQELGTHCYVRLPAERIISSSARVKPKRRMMA